MTRFIVSTGHGDAAMIPLDRLERPKVKKSGWFSMSTSMVGTPYKDLHLLIGNGNCMHLVTCKMYQIRCNVIGLVKPGFFMRLVML